MENKSGGMAIIGPCVPTVERPCFFRSPARLDLRLFCTPETPASDTLDAWPAFPLIIAGNVALSSGTDNIVAALGQNNRVCQVNLRLADWQLGPVLAALKESFPELTDLRLFSRYETPPVDPDSDSPFDSYQLSDESDSSSDPPSDSPSHQLSDESSPVIPDLPSDSFSDSSSDDSSPVIPDSLPKSFLDGSAPRLRHLSLSIPPRPFLGLSDLLSSANNLVRLYLHRIPHSVYISPKGMVALLSRLSSLRTLTLAFQPPQSFPDWESRASPPSKLSILPALDEFCFRGITEYLEDLVTFIDAPQLNNMDITFFHRTDFDCPRLAQFIDRTPTLRARDEAHVKFNDWSAGIVLFNRFSTLGIEISCNKPDSQLLSVTEVCSSSFPPLSTVEDLYIEHRYWRLVWENDATENALWLELLPPFTAVKNLYLSKDFAPGIAAALLELVGGRITDVLPCLQNILVEGLEPSGPLRETIGQFVAARQLSDHPIAISVWDRGRKLSRILARP